MDNSKLTGLICSLNQHEINSFYKYLSSPFFNADSKLSKLFSVLLKEKNQALPKYNIYKLCFHKKKYDDKEMRYLISFLSKHLERFIALRKFTSDNLLFNSVALKALAEKDCEKAFHFVHHEITQHKDIQNALFYYYQFNAAENYLGYISTKQKRKIKLDFESVLQNLDVFYTAKKLQLLCETTNLQNVLSAEYNILLQEEIKKIASAHFKDIPVIQIYYRILMTLSDPGNENHFDELQNLLHKNGKLFPPAELKDMYQYIKNYCVKKLNQGQTGYTKKLFEIYKDILSDKRLMYHDYFSQWEFKNLVAISLRLNEKQWCRNFISKYINYLPPSERKNALTYNMAYWYLSDENYKMALKQLQKVEFTDVFYQLDSRVILLKTYFETDDYESLFYHLSAFRAFLRRNRLISDYQQALYRNLVKFTAKLARNITVKSKLLSIKNEIKNTTQVADKRWLDEQLNVLL